MDDNNGDDDVGGINTLGNRRMSERDLSRMGAAESSKSLGVIGGPLIANSHTSHSLNQHLNLSNSNINNSHNHNNSNSINNNSSSNIMSPLAAHLPNSKSVPALHHHTGSGNICKLYTQTPYSLLSLTL